MVDRTELLESTLDALSEGLVLIDQEGRIALWNRAAETITGYSAAETVGRRAPEMLEALVVGGLQQWIHQTNTQLSTQRGMVVQIRHKLNQGVPVFARTLVLRDAMDERIGNGVIFHPTERLDALPRGQLSDDADGGESRLSSRSG